MYVLLLFERLVAREAMVDGIPKILPRVGAFPTWFTVNNFLSSRYCGGIVVLARLRARGILALIRAVGLSSCVDSLGTSVSGKCSKRNKEMAAHNCQAK